MMHTNPTQAQPLAYTPDIGHAPSKPTPSFGVQQAMPVDTVRFGAEKSKATAESRSGKIRNIIKGFKEGFKAIFNVKGLLEDAAVMGLMGLTLFIIPGPQFFSVPAYLAVSAAFRFIFGFAEGKNNRNYKYHSFLMYLYNTLRGKESNVQTTSESTPSTKTKQRTSSNVPLIVDVSHLEKSENSGDDSSGEDGGNFGGSGNDSGNLPN